MGRESRAEPERAHLVAADALVPQPQLDDVGEQLRNRGGLDELDLTADELGERLAIDPVLHPLRPPSPVDLRQRRFASAGRRPVSRAHRSIVLHRQTDERPSLPIGFGNPGPVASIHSLRRDPRPLQQCPSQ